MTRKISKNHMETLGYWLTLSSFILGILAAVSGLLGFVISPSDNFYKDLLGSRTRFDVQGVSFSYYTPDGKLFKSEDENPTVNLKDIEKIVLSVNFLNAGTETLETEISAMELTTSDGETVRTPSIPGFSRVEIPPNFSATMPRGRDISSKALLEKLEKDSNYSWRIKLIGNYRAKGASKTFPIQQGVICRNVFTEDRLPEFKAGCAIVKTES